MRTNGGSGLEDSKLVFGKGRTLTSMKYVGRAGYKGAEL